MRRRISRKRRAGSDQELSQPRLHEGGQIILPQVQVAAVKIFGIDHRAISAGAPVAEARGAVTPLLW
jgi:hypothetical protein